MDGEPEVEMTTPPPFCAAYGRTAGALWPLDQTSGKVQEPGKFQLGLFESQENCRAAPTASLSGRLYGGGEGVFSPLARHSDSITGASGPTSAEVSSQYLHHSMRRPHFPAF